MSYPKVLFLAINFTLSKNKEMMNFIRKERLKRQKIAK